MPTPGEPHTATTSHVSDSVALVAPCHGRCLRVLTILRSHPQKLSSASRSIQELLRSGWCVA